MYLNLVKVHSESVPSNSILCIPICKGRKIISNWELNSKGWRIQLVSMLLTC